MPQPDYPTFVYRGHGVEVCVFASQLTVTERALPEARTDTCDLHAIREVQVDHGTDLVIQLADGTLMRYRLGSSAAALIREAIVRAL